LSESSLPLSDPGTQKRRSTRIVQAVPITVSGVDALGQPFKERTTTVMVNCHGCKYQSKHYVPRNSIVTLEIPRVEPAFPPLIVAGHVVWVQRPRTVRELFQIGLEFETVGNAWGIAFPPEDWVPFTESEAAAAESQPEIEVIVETKPAAVLPGPVTPIPAAPENKIQMSGVVPAPPSIRLPAPAASALNPQIVDETSATQTPRSAPAAASTATVPPAAPGDAKIHVMPLPAAETPDAQIVIARQIAKMVAEAKETLDKTLRRGAQAAVNEEMTVVRQQLDAQMHETVEHAIKSLIERVSEAEAKKVVLQAANKTAAIVEEARLASQASAQRIDANVRESLQHAVSEASAQVTSQTATSKEELRRAAQEAESHAAAQAADRASALVEEARRASETNAQLIEERIRHSGEMVRQSVAEELKQSIHELVERAIAEQQANLPPINVPPTKENASSELAQQHLGDWRRNLDESAQAVRSEMAAQSQAEGEAASRRLRQELEAALAESSRTLSDRLNELSHTAISNAERNIADRSSSLRALIDEVVAGAQSSVFSLGTELAQQRAQTEDVKAGLQEAARTIIEQTRRQMDDVVAAQQEASGRRAEELIAERIHHLEPVLRNSTQTVMENFSIELNQKIAPRLEEVQRAVWEIGNTTRHAEELQRNLREQVYQATEQAAQIQNSIQDRVQQVSDSAVQKAIFDLTNVQQQAAELQGNIRWEIQQAAEQASHIQSSTQERVQTASDLAVTNTVAELAFAGQELLRLQDGVRDESRRASEQVSQIGSTTLERVESAFSEAARKLASEVESAGQLATQLQNNVRDQVDQASARAAEIENSIRAQVRQASEQADEIHKLSLQQIRQTSEQTVQEAIDRIRQETARVPAELEQTCRTTINRLEEELDQKSSDLQHAAYEALLKNSEWYQKKAQTSMNSTMERVIEQSSNTMHEKAAEVSSMLASELDHYGRSYVEHGRAEIEEAGKEMTDRERLRLSETAAIASATFTDRVQHVTQESLRRFQESSREALEKARSDMEFNRESSLTEFQKVLDEKMTEGAEHAGTYLQSQLIPLLESWEEKREAEKQEWMIHLQESSQESIEAYKARLENATNAWLLASAATLGQNSQAVLDHLAKSAEKRMRDTCSQVLAAMGDVLKDRLLGISDSLSAEAKE
jgi:hypothetical protein